MAIECCVIMRATLAHCFYYLYIITEWRLATALQHKLAICMLYRLYSLTSKLHIQHGTVTELLIFNSVLFGLVQYQVFIVDYRMYLVTAICSQILL